MKKSQSLIKPESVNRTKCFSNSSRSPLASHIKCRSTFNRGRNDVLMHSCTCYYLSRHRRGVFSSKCDQRHCSRSKCVSHTAWRSARASASQYYFTITRRGATYSTAQRFPTISYPLAHFERFSRTT